MTLHIAATASDRTLIGQALIGIPLDIMHEHDLQTGDTVAVKVAKTTHARVWPQPPKGETARFSQQVIANAGGVFGDIAKIDKVDLETAKTVIISILDDSNTAASDLIEALYDLPLTLGDQLAVALPLGRVARIEVADIEPGPAGIFRDTTMLTLTTTSENTPNYEGVGGLEGQISRIHEMVALPLFRPDLFEHLAITAPRGVLFTGSPGSGKTLLARAVAANTSAAFFQISGPEIVSKHYGESEAALRRLFEAAQKQAPAIIFIDEIDAIAPKRDGLSAEKQVERRIVAQLLTLMDGLPERGRVVVMAATNLPDGLDPALRRPGRFDREISFSAPDASQRLEILQIHLRDTPLASDTDLSAIADACHGYVGADLAALTREATISAIERTGKAAGGQEKIQIDTLFLKQSDLLNGYAVTAPSILRDTVVETQRIDFTDVGGLSSAKAALTQAIMWPQMYKQLCDKLGVSATSGVLLSGPPGSGKTLLARALATESRMNFIPVQPGKIMSQFMGEAERAITDIFSKARQSAPCLIFFDEIDSLAPRRSGKDATLDRIVAQMLTELDGLKENGNIVIVAATNRAGAIDPALTRPGRFDTLIPIGLPDLETRIAILAVHAAKMALGPNVDLDEIARQTDGASGAMLAALTQAASRAALGRVLQTDPPEQLVDQADFASALATMAGTEITRNTNFINQDGGANANS